MDDRLLVEIFVPVINGNEGKIATGYPVAKDLILTARHALFSDDRDRTKPIELRWHFNGTPWSPIAFEDIVWDGAKDGLDAALVKFPLPEDVRQVGWLSAEIPRPNDLWWSSGFAEVGKRANNKRPAVGLIGEIIAANATNGDCEIGVKYTGQGAQQWQGVSGAPIVSGRVIVGIAKSCPTLFSGKRLHVTLVHSLLNNPAFRKKVGVVEQNRRLKRSKKKIKSILDQSESAAKLLRDELRETSPDIASDNESLVENLLRTTFETVIRRLHAAIVELQEEGDLAAATTLKKLSCLLMPLVFDNGVVDSIGRACNEPAIALIDAPVATSTLAELIMAGIDGRSAHFKILPQGHRWPVGRNCLEKLPEAGISSENSFVDRFHDVIIDEFLGEDEKARRPKLSREQQIKRASQVLEDLAKPPNAQTRYVIYQSVDDTLRRQIEQLKANYRDLVFLSLDPDGDNFLKETQRIGRLSALLLDNEEQNQ